MSTYSDERAAALKAAQALVSDGSVKRRGDIIDVDLQYPGAAGRPTVVEVGLVHVRAADSIRISYDFERDGWSIKQASTFRWQAGDPVCDMDWQEVAFVEAWAREKPGPDDDQAAPIPQPKERA